ncbi:hypothetical protein [Sulfitobacter noctilucae]|uniref:hypothetical protein n=1 Tax=Sulfitobacter noctilucae TaxID=1342302 RepID=UPI00046AD2F5|nr:hypothetical protein [Sulfitobacter noctilucae]
MKPSFALSLSFDGIRLLHRAAGGWRVVGDVALNAADMSAELAVLRRTATALESGGLRSKVLLPNEQIKYLSIDTPGMDDSARRAAATAALDGATPYAVDDLAFDISAEGDVTHIAAVARETLAEAEAFAAEHRFHPVSFAAIPGAQSYLGEPFFGVASGAASLLEPGETVEPDGIAVVVVGDVKAPAGPVVSEPEAENASAPEPETKAPEPTNETVEEAVVSATEEPSATEAEDESPESEETPIKAPPAPEPPTATSSAGAVAEPKAASANLGFASRRAPDKPTAPQLDGVKRDQKTPSAPAPLPDPPKVSVAAPRIEIDAEASPAVVPPPAAPAAPIVAPVTDAPPTTGFLSRRKAKPAATAHLPASTDMTEETGSERERMTIFGARKSQVGGKPRFLGLILTAALLVFLAGVAAWASVFLDDGISLSRLFKDRSAPETATVTSELPVAPDTATSAPIADPVELAALDPSLTEEDSAVLDALQDLTQPGTDAPLEPADVEASYAATGIWPQAPDVPGEPAALIGLDELYLTSIDPVSTTTDAVALPLSSSFDSDLVLATVSSPAAAGTQFALNPQGLVIPTAQGALSPDGFTVYLGRPPLVPPVVPTRFESVPEDNVLRTALAALRPQPRPSDLAEQSERANLDGLTRTELAAYRPSLRPKSIQQQAEAAAAPPAADPEPIVTDGAVALALTPPDPTAGATKYAVRASIRPDLRPRNFARIVQRARRAAPQQEVRVASVAPRVVAPKIPSKTSVARQATVKNAINLRKVNLIGVYGKPSNRRALVRLSNGRYRKVVVGDKIDGGRVSAIGEGELRYTKRGRNLVLKMPR